MGAESDAGPSRRSRTATRSRLLSSSAEVFAEKGIEAASVEELCAAAGFTRGAFYSNFASKTDPALAMYEEHIRQLAERLNGQLDQWLHSGGVEPAAVVDGQRKMLADTVTAALVRIAAAHNAVFTVDPAELSRVLLAVYCGLLNEQIAGGGSHLPQLNLVAMTWQSLTAPGPLPAP